MIPLTAKEEGRMRNLVRLAEISGELVRPENCETCDNKEILIKHHRDYNKPLEITWLCRSCHGKEHALLDGKKLIEHPKGNFSERRESIRRRIRGNFSVLKVVFESQYMALYRYLNGHKAKEKNINAVEQALTRLEKESKK